jgi:hypothetical protein
MDVLMNFTLYGEGRMKLVEYAIWWNNYLQDAEDAMHKHC